MCAQERALEPYMGWTTKKIHFSTPELGQIDDLVGRVDLLLGRGDLYLFARYKQHLWNIKQNSTKNITHDNRNY